MRAAAVRAGVDQETCDSLFNNMSQDVLLRAAADQDAAAAPAQEVCLLLCKLINPNPNNTNTDPNPSPVGRGHGR